VSTDATPKKRNKNWNINYYDKSVKKLEVKEVTKCKRKNMKFG